MVQQRLAITIGLVQRILIELFDAQVSYGN